MSEGETGQDMRERESNAAYLWFANILIYFMIVVIILYIAVSTYFVLNRNGKASLT